MPTTHAHLMRCSQLGDVVPRVPDSPPQPRSPPGQPACGFGKSNPGASLNMPNLGIQQAAPNYNNSLGISNIGLDQPVVRPNNYVGLNNFVSVAAHYVMVADLKTAAGALVVSRSRRSHSMHCSALAEAGHCTRQHACVLRLQADAHRFGCPFLRLDVSISLLCCGCRRLRRLQSFEVHVSMSLSRTRGSATAARRGRSGTSAGCAP
jgi:hypothetical protein